MKPAEAIADALRLLREARGRSLKEAGQALGVAPWVVGAWEQGRCRMRLDQFVRLADWLGVDLGDLDDALELAGAAPARRRKRPAGGPQLDPRRLARRVLHRDDGRPGEDRLERELARMLEALIGLTADSRRASGKADRRGSDDR